MIGRIGLVALLVGAVADCGTDADATAPSLPALTLPSLAVIAQAPPPTVWRASCGSITQAGLWTAPSTPATCTITAERDWGSADTVWTGVGTALVPPPTASGGKPFGPFGYLGSVPATASHEAANTPSSLLNAIAAARSSGRKLMAALPCGQHNPPNLGYCLRDSSGVAVFSMLGYDTALARYNRSDVLSAVSKAYADGVLLRINLIDEPWVNGQGDGNTWGPNGLTKQQVDTICAKAKRLFPGVPVGTSDYHGWEPAKSIRVCDAMTQQFSYRFVALSQFGSIRKWRDSALAIARRDGYGRVFSFNPINGGTPRPSGGTCPNGAPPGQGPTQCQMTPAQIVAVVDSLGDAGCGAMLWWRDDANRFDAPAYQDAFRQAAALEAARGAKPCVRR